MYIISGINETGKYLLSTLLWILFIVIIIVPIVYVPYLTTWAFSKWLPNIFTVQATTTFIDMYGTGVVLLLGLFLIGSFISIISMGLYAMWKDSCNIVDSILWSWKNKRDRKKTEKKCEEISNNIRKIS